MRLWRGGDEGQTAIALVPVLLLFVVCGAAVIDVGSLLNTRRIAQSDVDRAALAGASAFTLEIANSAADTSQAISRATDWATRNGIDTTAPGFSVQVVSNCYSSNDGIPDGVTVSVDRPAPSFFVHALGILNWNAPATATACAGHSVSATGFLPWALSMSGNCFQNDGYGGREPKWGARCDIVVNSNSNGLSGELGVAIGGQCSDGNPSSSVVRQNIANGVTAYCSIGDSIQGNGGYSVGANRQGLSQRLSTDGACDANYPGTAADFNAANAALDAVVSVPLEYPSTPARNDGVDDFYETYRYDPNAPGPAYDLEPYDCNPSKAGLQTSPRNVTVVVINNYAVPDGNAGPKSYIVRGFAGMYIEGCTGNNGVFSKTCNVPGGPFTVHARFVNRVNLSNSNLTLGSVGDVGIFLAR